MSRRSQSHHGQLSLLAMFVSLFFMSADVLAQNTRPIGRLVSESGQMVVAYDNGTFEFYPSTEPGTRARVKVVATQHVLVPSPGGRMVAIAPVRTQAGGLVQVWDTGGAPVGQFGMPVNGRVLGVNETGTLVAVAVPPAEPGESAQLRLYSPQGQVLQVFDPEEGHFELRFRRDGALMGFGRPNEAGRPFVRWFDGQGRLASEYRYPADSDVAIIDVIGRDGRALALVGSTGSDRSGFPERLDVIDPHVGLQHSFELPLGEIIESVVASPSGRYALCRFGSLGLVLFDTDTGQTLLTTGQGDLPLDFIVDAKVTDGGAIVVIGTRTDDAGDAHLEGLVLDPRGQQQFAWPMPEMGSDTLALADTRLQPVRCGHFFVLNDLSHPQLVPWPGLLP